MKSDRLPCTEKRWHHFAAVARLLECRKAEPQLEVWSVNMFVVWRDFIVDDKNIAIAN